MKAEPVEELRKQASIAVRVLKVFRGAALLLDEVRRRLRVTVEGGVALTVQSITRCPVHQYLCPIRHDVLLRVLL